MSLRLTDQKLVPAPDAVIWLPGPKPPTAGTQPWKRPEIASRDKRFRPRVVAVPAGTVVSFPNRDEIFHNVFSLSEAARFDLGLYRRGDARSMRFEKPGIVRIYCNIHPQMAAFLLVVDGEVLGQTGPDGSVGIEGVPPGTHAVKVWQERGGEWTGTVEIRAGQVSNLPVVLDGSSYKEAAHKNKYGKEYPRPDDDENRY